MIIWQNDDYSPLSSALFLWLQYSVAQLSQFSGVKQVIYSHTIHIDVHPESTKRPEQSIRPARLYCSLFSYS